MSKLTFRSQFGVAFLLVLLLSFACSIAVWGASTYYIFTNEKTVRPANYYEKRIPEITGYALGQKEALLTPAARTALEERIPVAGIQYQVLDAQGKFLYGTMDKSYISSKEELVSKLNTNERVNGKIVLYYPVTDAQGGLTGAFVLRYDLSLVTSNADQPMATFLLIVTNLAAPFVFIMLFTFLFARRLGTRLKPPVSRLTDGARRIQQGDLDFTLADVGGSKELAELASAFEEMRRALHDSLTAQWKMEQQRRDMVAAITHDLRTPLTIIQGHVDNLLEGAEQRPDRLPRYLRTIQGNTERAARLLDELTTISDIERPDFTLSPVAFEPLPFFERKRDDYKLLCESKQVALLLDTDGLPPAQPLRIDFLRLEQIMDNLMANSLRFTPEGGEIHWQVGYRDGRLHFEVQDTGRGFSVNDLAHLFEQFYQGDPSRSEEKGHAGLGLYIVKKLAEKHGGHVAAFNRPEGGARICVTLKEMASA
ncbi:sensor histidine kinase [Paenibacillus tyrfis]|uniref:sensor histidine kinase n=1 Tax=Paenibacillus tyrfis TaxID=1501230 RepID=UPI00248F7835|nr:HAMP domain-containing sensor histidine kinase [Paenibacillus tyrfis]GLI03999.1 sensor histidine kinase [Paenibacillus tyrfis]